MLFCRRNLVYGDYDFVFNVVKPPYVLVATGDYHDGYLLRFGDLFLQDEEIYFVPTYNVAQFRSAISQAIELGLPIIFINLHRLFTVEKFHELNNAIYPLLNDYEEAVFMTTKPMSSKDYPPKPYAPHYVRHLSDVVVFSRKVRGGYSVYVVKHPHLPYVKVFMGDRYGAKLSIYKSLA